MCSAFLELSGFTSKAITVSVHSITSSSWAVSPPNLPCCPSLAAARKKVSAAFDDGRGQREACVKGSGMDVGTSGISAKTPKATQIGNGRCPPYSAGPVRDPKGPLRGQERLSSAATNQARDPP